MGATAFITQQVSQVGDVIGNIIAVIKAEIGTRSKYAGNSMFSAAGGPGGAQQIVFDFYIRIIKYPG